MKSQKRILVSVISGILAFIMLSACFTFTASADTKVNAFGGNGDHSAIEGSVIAERLYINGEFNGYGIAMPTWCTTGSTCTMSLFSWTGSYDGTLEGEALASRSLECADNATNWVEFDPLPAGEYLFVIHEIVGKVGAWGRNNNEGAGGFLYIDGDESPKDLEIIVRFTDKPDTPFIPCEASQVYDGNHTAPAEYDIPDDSKIKTHEVMPDTWVFTDALGRTSLTNADVGDLKEDKTLAMFYWTWHCSQGSDSVDPLNIQEFLEEHPECTNDYTNPAWPASGANFWNEPIYGYYRGYDRWVIRRQGELLTNAGIDVIFTDNTNSTATWKSGYTAVFETWSKAMDDGVNMPKVSFMLPFSASDDANTQMQMLYKDIFYENKYQKLWFYWDSKPMLMAWQGNLNLKENINKEIKNFFTFRNNYPGYINNSSGKTGSYGQWGWLSMYPQAFYYANKTDARKNAVEQITVGVAMNHNYMTHQLSAMNGDHIAGRSYTSDLSHINEENAKLWGYNFAEQFDYALTVDPKVVFVTGWNEWIAGRYDVWQGVPNALPDECNDEYSRDIEPSKGDLGDNYYYQLVNYSRKYKGARPIPAPTSAATVDLTKGAEQWENIGPYYAAYIGNTDDRDCKGYGTYYYTEYSGRNDLIGARVARDDEFVYFFVECNEDITPYTDNLWMTLYIDSDQSNQGWNTFEYVINKSAASATTVVLEKFTGNGYDTEKVTDCAYKVDGKTMTVKVPKSALNLTGYDFTINFTWTDNVHDEADHGTQDADGNWTYSAFSGDIMDFYISGDVAPGGRFKFSYISTADNAGMGESVTVDETESEPATENDTEYVTINASETGADVTKNVTDADETGCQSVLGGMGFVLAAMLTVLGCAWKKEE